MALALLRSLRREGEMEVARGEAATLGFAAGEDAGRGGDARKRHGRRQGGLEVVVSQLGPEEAWKSASIGVVEGGSLGGSVRRRVGEAGQGPRGGDLSAGRRRRRRGGDRRRRGRRRRPCGRCSGRDDGLRVVAGWFSGAGETGKPASWWSGRVPGGMAAIGNGSSGEREKRGL